MKKIFTLLLVFAAILSSTIFAQCNPEFTFTVNANLGTAQFTPVNNNAVQHHWSFGDGTSSYFADPSHAYAPGAYNVVHVVAAYSPNDSNVIQCIDSSVQWVTITAPQACNLNASFSFLRDSILTNTVYFTNRSSNTNPNTVTEWNFGDGYSSYNNNPAHVYQTSGIYTVCLRVKRDELCFADTCATIQVQVPPCNISVNFNTVTDSISPGIIHFNNLTNLLTPSDSLTWSFGDGTTSDETNPTHIYTTGGTYNVCLAVKRFANNTVACVREFCHPVTVQIFCDIVPDFTYSKNSFTYFFGNNTSNLSSVDSSFWDFGDGSTILINPTNAIHHSYTNTGNYTVCLRVKKVQSSTGNVICERQVCKTILVDTAQVQCNLQAYFSHTADSTAYKTIYFSNQSTPQSNSDSVQWSFGDGTSSTLSNPVHTYNTPGTYNVCIRVTKNEAPSTVPCIGEYCQTIVVQPIIGCNIHAGFSFIVDSIQNSGVTFINISTSTTPDTITSWSFGDGTLSYSNSPSHVYQVSGTYTVCLTVKSGNACADSICRIVQVQVPTNNCNLQVNFSTLIDSNHTNVYHFTNLSTPLSGSDSAVWNFGDGTVSHDLFGVTHTYTQGGVFEVCLTVSNNTNASPVPCVRQFCQRIIVDTPQVQCNLQAYFLTIEDSINHNSIHFINQSAPLSVTDSICWVFGDGIVSTDINSVHTYNQSGTYTICLRVKKAQTATTLSCVSEYCKTVIVSTPANPCNQLQVNFNWRADSANNRKIYFINQSSPIAANTSANWSFGDGTSGIAYNPDHIYAHPGTYLVCLTVRTGNCSRDTCKTIVIIPATVDSCNIQPFFTTYLDSFNRRKIYFTNHTSPSSLNANAVWSFGDGTSSTGWNADHIYQIPGWYAVCLTVSTGNNCTRTYCDSVYVPGNVIPPVNCDSFHLQYGYRSDGYVQNKVYFVTTGNAPTYNQQWEFTKVGDSSSIIVNQDNPVYVFADTGLYRVCVKAAFSTNCTKEYCDNVRVRNVSVPSRCVLQSYPNPARNHVSFNVQLEQADIITTSVFNFYNGHVLSNTQQGTAGNNLVTLNIQHLPRGFYGVRIMHGRRVCYTRFLKI